LVLSICVGCQGWRYPDWRVVAPVQDKLAAPFYTKVSAAKELYYYSCTFGLVEVDSTFYAIPSAKVVQGWAEQTPEDFRFTLKLPRALTHEARLQRGRRTLAEFCDVAHVLGLKLAAVLIQLPPSFGTSEFGVLERFAEHLPKDLPFAIEFRDPEWLSERTISLLKTHDIALTLGDTPWIDTEAALPWLDQLPTDWLYLRFMGPKEGGIEHFTHLQADKEEMLDTWAEEIQVLNASGKRIYALFDNHLQGFSPGSATLMIRKLGLSENPFPRDQKPPVEQLGLDLGT
jgi:uncharacterized protein YecE (DUF72 family)